MQFIVSYKECRLAVLTMMILLFVLWKSINKNTRCVIDVFESQYLRSKTKYRLIASHVWTKARLPVNVKESWLHVFGVMKFPSNIERSIYMRRSWSFNDDYARSDCINELMDMACILRRPRMCYEWYQCIKLITFTQWCVARICIEG